MPKGRVIGSDPKAGTTLKPNTIVDLLVSKGPRPITIRDWTGKEADRAEQSLERKGLEVDSDQQEYSDDVPEGYVISQSPSDGTLFRGETVTLVVSQGPELVEVPDGLVASGVEDARERLTDLGFDVELDRAPGYLGIGYVLRRRPGVRRDGAQGQHDHPHHHLALTRPKFAKKPADPPEVLAGQRSRVSS